jgi:hypothetical protein
MGVSRGSQRSTKQKNYYKPNLPVYIQLKRLYWYHANLPQSCPQFKIVDKHLCIQIDEDEMRYYEAHRLTEDEMSGVECTACRGQVNGLHPGAAIRHPELGVVICRSCKKKYHAGEWTR